MDIKKVVEEFHSYNEPPETLLKVVRAVLALVGHGKSTGQDTSTWAQCRPLCTHAMVKEMQTLNLVFVDKALHTEDRWKEAAEITRGMDLGHEMRRFPHGVKIMLQWLEAARLVHRMAVQVHRDEQRRKQAAKDKAIFVVQAFWRGQAVRNGLRKLLGDARNALDLTAKEKAERRAKVREWREAKNDPLATPPSGGPPPAP